MAEPKKRFYFFSPGKKVWLDLVRRLKENELAFPVLYLGDSRYDDKIREIIPSCRVINLSRFIKRKEDLKFGALGINDASFFEWRDFFFIKDRALKMMDRLEKEKNFSRVDREAIFNQVCFFAIFRVRQDKPDFLLMGESPHQYVQYIFYEVCRFYGIPTLSFGSWGIAPVLYLQDEATRAPIPSRTFSKNLYRKTFCQVEHILERYVEDISEARSNYSPDYMQAQERATSRYGHFIQKSLGKGFNAAKVLATPDKSVSRVRSIIAEQKKKQRLGKKVKSLVVNPDLDSPFVYFPLHYEPERTTNPDGAAFHDQARVVGTLREYLPESVALYVKEHPSQLYSCNPGHLGRSEYFYDLIDNAVGVYLIPPEFSSIRLIDNSIFAATVTGAAALEAAIRGKKSIVFGNAWYLGCPNVHRWETVSPFIDFCALDTFGKEHVHEFLLSKFRYFGVVGYQNPSADRRWNALNGLDFIKAEQDGVYHLVEKFLC